MLLLSALVSLELRSLTIKDRVSCTKRQYCTMTVFASMSFTRQVAITHFPMIEWQLRRIAGNPAATDFVLKRQVELGTSGSEIWRNVCR